MAALAAMRAGAGYVTRRRAGQACELELHGQTARGDDGRAARRRRRRTSTPRRVEPVLKAIGRADAVVLGPGLSQGPGRAGVRARASCARIDVPLVIDADGLNALRRAARRRCSPQRRWPTVLTPHAGELGRLLERRLRGGRARAAAPRARGGGALAGVRGAQGRRHAGRGARTGAWRSRAAARRRSPRPGTGDVLSGVIGAMLAKGMPARPGRVRRRLRARARGAARRRAARARRRDRVRRDRALPGRAAARNLRAHGADGRATSWTSTPATVYPDDPVETVLRALRDHELPGVPVVNEGGRCVGIITEPDLVIADEEERPPPPALHRAVRRRRLPRAAEAASRSALRKAIASTARGHDDRGPGHGRAGRDGRGGRAADRRAQAQPAAGGRARPARRGRHARSTCSRRSPRTDACRAALARVDVGAIERNCARLRGRRPPARAVRGRQGRRLRARRRAGRARGARAAAPTWLAVATAGEAAALRGGGARTAPLLVMGALTPDGAATSRSPPAPTSSPGARRFVARCRRAARRARQARHAAWAASARATPSEADAGRATAAARHAAGRRDDPLRHRRRRRRRLLRRAARRASAPGRGRSPAASRAVVHAANSRGHAARARRAHFDMVRCGDRDLRPGPVPARPGRARARAGAASCAPTSPRSSARAPGESAGYGRRFVAERDDLDRARSRSATATACGAALTNNADVLVGGRRVPARRHGLDGQRHRRPRRRAGRARRRGRADRRARRRADPRRGGRAARSGTINYEITCGICRAGAAGTTRREPTGARRPRARRSRGERGVARRRRGARPAARPRRPTTSTSRVAGDPRPRRAALARAAAAARAFPLSRRVRRLAGRRARPRLAGRPRRRCATATSSADLAQRDFTINAMAEPLAGGELLDPHGGRGDLARRRAADGLGAARSPTTRCARCGRSGFAVELDLEIDAGDRRGRRGARAGLERRRRRAGLRRAQARDRRRRRPARARADGRARR